MKWPQRCEKTERGCSLWILCTNGAIIKGLLGRRGCWGIFSAGAGGPKWRTAAHMSIAAAARLEGLLLLISRGLDQDQIHSARWPTMTEPRTLRHATAPQRANAGNMDCRRVLGVSRSASTCLKSAGSLGWWEWAFYFSSRSSVWASTRSVASRRSLPRGKFCRADEEQSVCLIVFFLSSNHRAGTCRMMRLCLPPTVGAPTLSSRRRSSPLVPRLPSPNTTSRLPSLLTRQAPASSPHLPPPPPPRRDPHLRVHWPRLPPLPTFLHLLQPPPLLLYLQRWGMNSPQHP